jgi:hypothetical protein
MFINLLAISFYVFALIAAFKMESFVKGLLFILVVIAISGLLYLFILFPGVSGLAVAIILLAFILKQGSR